MIVLDTTAASLLFVPNAIPHHDGKPIKYARERLDSLIERIAKANEIIVIPTPVLSELVVKVHEKANELIKEIRTSPWFRIEPFDAAAAVELGLRTARAIADGDKREGSKADWTKIKIRPANRRDRHSERRVANPLERSGRKGNRQQVGYRCYWGSGPAHSGGTHPAALDRSDATRPSGGALG
jgi:hypothetical protein